MICIMKTIMTMLLVATFIISCGYPAKIVNGTRKYNSTDSSFSSYVAAFESTGSSLTGQTVSASKIPINFGEPSKREWAGEYISYSDGTSEIIIRKSKWDTYSEYDKRELIFHELGHAVLKREHDDTKYNNQPTSLMSTNHFNGSYYKQYQQGLDRELFLKDKGVINSLIAGS